MFGIEQLELCGNKLNKIKHPQIEKHVYGNSNFCQFWPVLSSGCLLGSEEFIQKGHFRSLTL